MEESVYDGKINLAYDRESFTYQGRIARESAQRMVASTRFQHPNSNMDVQWEGSLDTTRQAYILSTEAKYLTSRRETKVANLRAEINALSKEFSLDVRQNKHKMDTYFINPTSGLL